MLRDPSIVSPASISSDPKRALNTKDFGETKASKREREKKVYDKAREYDKAMVRM